MSSNISRILSNNNNIENPQNPSNNNGSANVTSAQAIISQSNAATYSSGAMTNHASNSLDTEFVVSQISTSQEEISAEELWSRLKVWIDQATTATDERTKEEYVHLAQKIYSCYKHKKTDLTLKYTGEVNELPPEIGLLTHLKTLKIQDSHLTSLPPEIGNLKNLEKLSLSSNKDLRTLPLEIGNLKNLKKIINTHNSQLNIPTELRTLSCLLNPVEKVEEEISIEMLSDRLQAWVNFAPNEKEKADRQKCAEKICSCYKEKKPTLWLSYYKITELPSEIGLLTHLKKLHISDIPLTALPSTIGNLFNLKALSIDNTQLITLPSEIHDLKKLETLNIDITDTFATASICKLPNLKYLKLSPSVDSLPSVIGQLKSIEKLEIEGRALKNLPPEIGLLENLTDLYLNKTGVTVLPAEIGKLKNLRKLKLYENKELTLLPREIGNLSKLQQLNIENSDQLTALPPEIGNLSNLRSLKIFYTGITSLPPEIGNLSNLEKLNIPGNRFTTLPPEIGNLSNLRKLLVYPRNNDYDRDYALASLCPQIGQLTNLIELSLVHNKLTSLPPEIGQLSKLEILDLSSNNISSLPNEIVHLPANLYLNLEFMPLSLHVLTNLSQIMNAPGYVGPRIRFNMSRLESGNSHGAPPLEDCLETLYTAAEKEPLELVQLTQDPKHAADLREWLWRLDDMGDYKTNRKELAQYIYQMVQKAETDPEYREAFLLSIDGAAETCGDRMALSLLYVDIQYQIGQSIKNQDWNRLAYLVGHGSWALNELEKIARNKAKTLHFVDEIEVYLAYPVKLKQTLDLPIVNEDMLYFACSSVTEEDLQNAYDIVKPALSNKESYCKHLAEEQTWHKALEALRPQQYQQIRTKRDQQKDPVKAAETYIQELSALTEEVLNTIGWPPFLQG